MKIFSIVTIILVLLVPTVSFAEGARLLSKKQFGDKWPLSVDKGVVKCLQIGNGAVVFEAKGKVYAVNGTAREVAKQRGFLLIDEIWINDPSYHKMIKEIAASEKKPIKEIMKIIRPTKVGIGPILDNGVALCH